MKKKHLVFLLLFAACSPDKTKLQEVLMKTDLDFSELSHSKGMKQAFLQYIDSDGVLLRADHYPIIGKKAAQFLRDSNDSSFSLTWKPLAAEVSRSADLGYTYGTYILTTKDTAMGGTYMSVWKKQNDGGWKFVLDTGNPGLGKQ